MRLTVLLIASWAIALPAAAQQARGLFLSVHGSEAPRSLGDPSSLKALYIDIPATTRGPVHIRIFDAETGGYLDSKRGAFNTRTRFVVLGGASAGKTYGIDSDPTRNRRLTFPASDIVFDESVGTNPRYDRRYWALPALPMDKGLPVAGGMRRFVLLVIGLDGDDANHFDYVVSTDPNDKIEPAGLSMFTYALTLRTPETPSFIGEVRIPTAGYESVGIETFGTGPAPLRATFPFSDPVALQPAASGSWNRQTLPLPKNTSSIGVQFNGHVRAHTFSVVVRRPDGQPIPIPLPIRDFEPVLMPRYSFRTDYPDTSCVVKTFSLTGETVPGFELTDIRWVFADRTETGSRMTRRFDSPGWHPFRLELDGKRDGQTVPIMIEDSIRINLPPSAWAGGDRAAVPGRSMAFDGTVSEDPDGRIIRYEWDFGDGNRGTGARVDHQYEAAGTYRVRLRVTDDSGSPCSTAETTAIVQVNRPPVARIRSSGSASPGSVVRFDGSGSTDPDGTIVEWVWTINGETFNGPVLDYLVTDSGPLTVFLDVTDNARTLNSTVRAEHRPRTNRLPVAVAGNDKHVSPNRPATYVGTRSSDPDGRVVRHEWIFPGDVRVEGATVQQGIAEPGWHTVYLEVTDNDGGVGRDSLRVRVNHPPVPVITGTLLSETMTVTLSGIDSHDPDEDGRIIRYDWTFGDGRTATGPTVTHTFARGDRHTVTLQVTDNSGTFSSRQRTSVEVELNHRPVARIPDPEPEVAPVVVPTRRNRAPVVNPVVPTEAGVGEPVIFDASGAEDPDGDALTLVWLVNGFEVGRGSRITHRFDVTGVYDISLIADDGTGQPNSFTRWVRTVHVFEP
jgi:PKD repeat protein